MKENHVIEHVWRIDLKQLLNKCIILAIVLCSFGLVSAQSPSGKASGVVLSKANGEPLIGVSIVIEGTTQGTVTNLDGQFEIEAKAGQTLKISYIGYETQFVKVTNSKLVVNLNEETTSLDEVIVMGYGVQKKKLVTGATVQVKGEDLQKRNSTNALQAMQGQTAGVNITSQSGQPGGGIKVNIRGVGTVGNSNPTYVVDGVITGDITYLNNSDIESIDVLKDAASCAIYGINGANGVVLITTKGGSSSAKPKGQLSFDAYYGIQNAARKADLLNSKEYAIMQNEAAINSGKTVYFNQAAIDAMGTGTNWLNEMLASNVPTQNYSLNAIGGGSTSNYSLGLSYTEQGGIVGGQDLSNYERYNARVNTEHKVLGDYVKVGQHFTFSFINQKGIKDGDQYNNSLRSAFNTSPFLEMYDNDGNFLNSNNSTFYNGSPWTNSESNPYAIMLYTNQNNTKYQKLVGDMYAEFQPAKNLKIKTSLGLDYVNKTAHSYSPQYELSLYAKDDETITQSTSTGYSWNWDNTINYVFDKDNHNLDVLVGSSIRQYNGSWTYGSNKGATLFGDLENAYLSNSTNSTEATLMSLTGNRDQKVAHASFFGRLNYNYNETYMASVIFRADGSTMFAKGHQWGYFPSISAGWVISNENFMESTKGWLDFLKIRASWGTNGNDNIKPNQYLSLMSLVNAQYNFGSTESTLTTGAYPSTNATKGLKWETSEQANFGFDARMLNGHLNLNFDLYNKKTKDWLVIASVPATAGVATDPYINGGNVTNKGVELQLSYNNSIGKDFKYTLSASYSYNKNTVNDIPTVDGIIHGGTNILFDNAPEFYRASDGEPVGYFWGYKTAGIFQNEEEVSSYTNKGKVLQPTAEPGDVKYVDINDDGVIDEDDRTNIGDPNPHHFFGFSVALNYKSFDFSVTASGVGGNKLVQSYRNQASRYSNWTSSILGRWHGEGTSNTMPRVTEDNANWAKFSDLYVKDGDYLRISNITLGYDFSKLIHKKFITKLRLYGAVENAFTFTKYDGMDPEVGFSAAGQSDTKYNFGQGVDIGYYPRPRTYLVGVNIQF
ncbi:MAG: TonB-dependent receptor [Bacteroidetes bacterium]|nr:TonB-dependent receptor [Bacteroidota bacterium]